MRLFTLLGSLAALVAALMLLVADSVGPCDSMEPAEAHYAYVLTCLDTTGTSQTAASGSVSFSNRDYSWVFEVEERRAEEEPTHPGEVAEDEDDEVVDPGLHKGEALEEETRVSFIVARTEVDLLACEPGRGQGSFTLAVAEAEVFFEGERHLFSCDVYPAAADVVCESGPVVWPGPDESSQQEETAREEDSICGLVLTATAAPSS